MKKKILLLPIIVFTCCKYSTHEVPENDVKKATAFFMDRMVSKAKYGENYIIYPSYNGELADSDFINLTEDTVFTKENIDYLKNQYNIQNKKNIRDFIDKKYYSKFSSSQPKVGQVSYSMDPPLFTIDKNHFIIYAMTCFWVKDKIRWDDLYFVFKRKGENWKFERFIKRKK
jgi:hypothetical protein